MHLSEISDVLHLACTCAAASMALRRCKNSVRIRRLLIKGCIRKKEEEWQARLINPLRHFCFIPHVGETEGADLPLLPGIFTRVWNCSSVPRWADLIMSITFQKPYHKIYLLLGTVKVMEFTDVQPDVRYRLLQDDRLGFPTQILAFENLNFLNDDINQTEPPLGSALSIWKSSDDRDVIHKGFLIFANGQKVSYNLGSFVLEDEQCPDEPIHIC